MTALALVLFAASVSIKLDTVDVREGCEASDEVIATLPSGTPVEIRFAMTGPSEVCYKISATHEGKPVQGYVPASALKGLDTFEASRTAAPAIRSASEPLGPPKPLTAAPPGSPDHPLVKAARLIDAHQPAAALEQVERYMRVQGREYQALVMAGIAAYNADQVRAALDYLREARALKQDRIVDQMLARIEQESSADKSSEKLYGTRFLLRYEGGNLQPELARAMIGTLEQEFSRISAELGCRTDERITTIVQSRQAYYASTGAAEWAAGHYDGKIHVPLAPSTAITPELRKAFAHELVHACLAQLGNYPTWLHEGFAQILSGDSITPSRLNTIRAALRENRIPRLENMSPSWSRMSTQHAAIAYTYALAAVTVLNERYHAYGIQNVLRNPDRLPAIAAEISQLLME